jgi:hypothetical protein
MGPELLLVDFFRGTGARKAVVGCRDWTLLVIGASDGLLPIQLQRSLYLLGERSPELTRSEFYRFQPVGSGEFSEQVYTDVDSLSKDGLVSIRFSERDGGRIYRLTPAGAERAKKLEKHARPELIQLLRRTVSWVSTRSVDQLLRGSIEKAGSRDPRSKDRDSIRPRGSA